MNWHYMNGDKQIGPLTVEEIGALIEADKLTEDTLVWNETLSDWTRLIDSGLVEVEEDLTPPPAPHTTAKNTTRKQSSKVIFFSKPRDSRNSGLNDNQPALIKPASSRLKWVYAIFICVGLFLLGFFLIFATTDENTSTSGVTKVNNRVDADERPDGDGDVRTSGGAQVNNGSGAAGEDGQENELRNQDYILRKKAGQIASFEIIQRLSFDNFPNLEELGIEAYEILLWSVKGGACATSQELNKYYSSRENTGRQALGKAILVTTETTFKSTGGAKLSVIHSGTCKTEDMKGFSHETVIFIEAKTSDILAYQAAQRTTQPLFDLIRKQDIETLKKYLADNKVSMEAETIQGKTALMYAIDQSDNEQLLDLLLQHGADINAQSSTGDYPLLWAIQRGREKTIMLLLERGANQKVRSKTGQGALELAIKLRRPSSIIDKLSQKTGTDVNEMIDNMPMLCWYIKRERYDEALKLLGAGADPNAVCNTPDRSSPLILASSKRLAEPVVQALLSAGAKIDYKNHQGYTALQMAVYYGNLKIFQLLVTNGADINARTDNGATALMCSTEKRYDRQVGADMVKELCRLGAKVNLQDNRKNTALHYAVQNKREEVLRELLGAETDVNVQNENGDTPLHIAAQAGLTDIIKLLLRFNAKTDITNKDGKTPQRVASSNAKMDAAEMLK